MSKIALILQVNDYLRRRGLSPLKNLETDLYLKCFYNRAEHGRNEGKVQYEALIRFDVKVRTVFFWDNVSLIESGQTSLSSSGRYHRYCLVTNQTNDLKQSIPTEFNLAEIPEFIRMAAKNNGWKFKAVFNRGMHSTPRSLIVRIKILHI